MTNNGREKHHIWCHVKISEVAALVSMIPNFWCCLEVAATELHLCFVIKGNVWWKRTFLPMATIVVLHHNYMKLFNPSTPHVIAWSVRKVFFNQSIHQSALTVVREGRVTSWTAVVSRNHETGRTVSNYYRNGYYTDVIKSCQSNISFCFI